MKIILSHFMTLDGVVQAPGGRKEDTDGGFEHGGWSMKYFDAEAMGPVLDSVLQRSDAMLFGRRTWQVAASAWPNRSGRPTTRSARSASCASVRARGCTCWAARRFPRSSSSTTSSTSTC